MNWLLIAGGAFVGAFVAPQETDMVNHTLRGEVVLAKEVVCRGRWGTPMLPAGKGGYSLTATSNAELIEKSLLQPPRSDDSTVFGVKKTREFGIFTPNGTLRDPSTSLTPFRPQAALLPSVPVSR